MLGSTLWGFVDGSIGQDAPARLMGRMAGQACRRQCLTTTEMSTQLASTVAAARHLLSTIYRTTTDRPHGG
jgi:hypothetical protein